MERRSLTEYFFYKKETKRRKQKDLKLQLIQERIMRKSVIRTGRATI